MKHSLTPILILLFGLPIVGISQKIKDPINYRFDKGEKGYISFFSKNVVYPDSSLLRCSIGLSIARVSISSAGKINDIKIVNSLDPEIDSEVNRIIELSADRWLPCDTIYRDQVFYLQFVFTISGYQPAFCNSNLSAFKAMFPEPIVITAFGNKINMEEFIDDDALADEANSLLDIGYYNNALSLVDNLIKRDPFNPELYKVRIMINSKFGNTQKMQEDQNKIDNFAEGISLNQILKEIPIQKESKRKKSKSAN